MRLYYGTGVSDTVSDGLTGPNDADLHDVDRVGRHVDGAVDVLDLKNSYPA